MNKVLILVGVPGSGKSYFTKKYIEQYGGEYTICSADHFFEDLARKKKQEVASLGSKEEVPDYLFDFTQLRTAHIECQKKFLNALNLEIPLIIVDNTNITKKERHFYVNEGLKHGYEVEIKAFPKDEETVKIASARNLHGVPADKIAQRALTQDLEPGMYKASFDTSDILGKKYNVNPVIESSMFIKKHLLKECSLDELMNDLTAVKEKATQTKTEYPEDKEPDIAEALDDLTGALDVAMHHIEDIKGKLSEESENPDTSKPKKLKVVVK